jgi:hypothetical protein
MCTFKKDFLAKNNFFFMFYRIKVTELADLVLDSYRSQLASLPTGGEKREEVGRQMERDRDQLIGPLVDRKLYEEAASLAEKYLDFDALGNGRRLISSIIGNRRS